MSQITDCITDQVPFQYHIVKTKKSRCGRGLKVLPGRLAAALLLLIVLRSEIDHGAAYRWPASGLAVVKSLARHDTVDF